MKHHIFNCSFTSTSVMPLWVEKTLFPLILVACLIAGVAYVTSQAPPPFSLQEVTINRPLEELAAYISSEDGLSSLWKSFLAVEGENVTVFLGDYRLKDYVVSRRGDEVLVVLTLEKAGSNGNALVFEGLPGGTEVYAVIKGEGTTIRPLFRILVPGDLLEIRGRAIGVDRVETYAYEFPEDFNVSKGPIPSLYVTSVPAEGGEYRLRIDLKGGPYTSEGAPILSVNKTIIVYGGCTYSSIYLENVTSTEIKVDLTCPP